MILDPSSILDPALFAERQLKLRLDPWQRQLLRAHRAAVNSCRQSGKSFTAAARIAQHLAAVPGAEVLVLSASEFHSGELVLDALNLLRPLGFRPRRIPGRQYDYALDSAIVRALPCRERAARSQTATLVVIDEAALIPDVIFYALSGTLATTWHTATLWVLSTPRTRNGFFYKLCTSPDPQWTRFRIPATECSRICPEFLAHQQATLPPWAYAQDYLCEFGDAAHAVFRDQDLMAAYNPAIPALSRAVTPMLTLAPPPRFYIGLDLAQIHDHAALVVLEYRDVYQNKIDPYTRAPITHPQLSVRWIQQFPNGTLYPDLITHLRNLLATPELRQHAAIIPDVTGQGGIFLDHLRAARLGAPIVPVTITPGTGRWTQVADRYHVPKQHLIANLESLFRHRQIQLASTCPGLDTLHQELTTFQRLVTPAGNETYSGKSTGHDDLVCALALAAWQATRHHQTALLERKQ